MSLRDYQLQAVDELRDAVNRHHSAVYMLPTGAGKTVVAGEISRLAAAKQTQTVLLVHRRELVRQAVDTLAEACPGLTIGVEAAGWPSIPWATLQVGMVQSISRRKFSINPGIVMVDEAHHARAATWEKVLQRWPKAMLIGLTATPQRLDGQGLDEFFNVMISGPTIPELVDMEFLAPTRTLTLPIALKLAGVRKTKHGEYRQSDLAERVTGSVVAKAADAYLRYAKGRKAIFFGIHIDHSKQVCAALRARGVRAEHVDGTDTMGRRDRVMLEFKAGDVDVVGNCDLISEGYDAPACDAILMGASTNSVTRYLQQAGRAMRYRPGKTALVLDLAGISHDLGLPDDVREWSLESGELDKRGKPNGIAPPKVCMRCRTAYRSRQCPMCGYQAPAAGVEEVETELEEAMGRQPKGRRGRKASYWQGLAAARKAADPRPVLERMAAEQGYKPGWVGHVLRVWRMA